MTSLTHRGHGPAFGYAGQPMHILAGQDGLPPGFAAMELTVPPHFAGPIPHAHDEFDEAIYVLSGRLLVHGDDEPAEAVPGSLFVAPRGHRHGFSNPSAEGALGWGSGHRRNPPWPSCARSARPCPPTSRPTRSGCATSTPATPAASSPERLLP
jgi:Cupin domain